jgi:hypothetical protein
VACGIHQDVQPPSEPSSEEDAPYFDAVWRAEATQAQVFDTLGLPLLERLLAGVNVCVLAYGQTGAGKTHTMMGPPKGSPASRDPAQKGLTPRFLYELHTRRVALEATGEPCLRRRPCSSLPPGRPQTLSSPSPCNSLASLRILRLKTGRTTDPRWCMILAAVDSPSPGGI